LALVSSQAFPPCARAQHRHAAAGDQLLRLGEELDLADAAAPELDVVALDRDGAVALVRMDLALDRMDVGNRRIIEIFAEDEGVRSRRKRSPAAMSPATARALMKAARSQFCPLPS
jgi:hypothetical protein